MTKCKAMCSGCRDDFYNHNREGGCWSYATARVVKRVSVGTWEPPPYRRKPQETLSCHHPDGRHWLDRSDVRVVEDSVAAVEKWREQCEAGRKDS